MYNKFVRQFGRSNNADKTTQDFELLLSSISELHEKEPNIKVEVAMEVEKPKSPPHQHTADERIESWLNKLFMNGGEVKKLSNYLRRSRGRIDFESE